MLDPRLTALGFSLDGTVLRGKNIVNCGIRLLSGTGCVVTTPNGETITVASVTSTNIENMTVGKGKVGFDLR